MGYHDRVVIANAALEFYLGDKINNEYGVRPMHENEIIVFLLASSVLFFLVYFRDQLMDLPHYRWLAGAFFMAWVAWLSTNLEHVMWFYLLNVIEHTAYALSSGLFLVWCVLAIKGDGWNAHDQQP